LPFVLVLARTNADMSFDPTIVAGAMFGNVSIQVPLGRDDVDTKIVFGLGGRLQRRLNRSVSAVAVLNVFNPTSWRVEQAMADRLGGEPSWRPSASQADVVREQTAVLCATIEIEEQLRVSGAYLPDARLVKLIVLHNPYATHPLGFEVLNAFHDVQWGNFERDGARGYGPARWDELLGREH
jgi:hypothetical protein